MQRSKGERQRLLVEMLGDAKPKKEPKPERAPQPWCALFLLGTLVLSYAAVALHWLDPPTPPAHRLLHPTVLVSTRGVAR